MRRWMAVLLVLALALSMAPMALAEAALPAVGDKESGFTVTDVSRYEMANSDMITYEHDKTGASVIMLLNQDTNRAFQIGFRTPAVNDTGLPHVFEHSTLDGSEKYPSASLFFNLTSQTYMTYMNAATYSFGFTIYPLASLSGEQLLSTADYYLDSVFYPMIMEDESIFREEAWRYAMDSLEDELTIEGTVYSEMSKSYDISHAHSQNAIRAMLPGSAMGNTTGGNPLYIPDMTWEDLKDFHNAYYHPSNSLTYIYGKLEDPGAYLALLDSYFSRFERTETDFADADFQPLTEETRTEAPFGVAQGTDTENGAYVTLAYALEGISDEEMNVLDQMTSLLNADASPMNQLMKERLPAASAACYTWDCAPGMGLVFDAKGLNREDAETFRDTVLESLETVAREGFDPALLDAVYHQSQMNYLLIPESSTLGNDLGANIFYSWYLRNDPYAFVKTMDNLEKMLPYAEANAYQDAISKWVLGNPSRALTTTYPEAGLKDRQEAALAEKLAGVKAGMTQAELTAIVDATAGRSESADDASKYVAQLQAVTVESLPEEIPLYEITDETDGENVRRVYVKAESGELGMGYLLIDASAIPQEELHWYRLYATLTGNIDTESRTRGELSAQITRYLTGFSKNTAIIEDDATHEFTPYFRLNFMALDGEMAEAYALLYETLYTPNLENTRQVADWITSQKTAVKQSINAAAHTQAYYRGLARTNESIAYANHMQMLDYYEFLCGAEKQMAETPEEVIAHLEGIRDQLANRYGAVTAYCGTEEGFQAQSAAADDFLAKLGCAETVPAEYDFGQMSKSEALILDVGANTSAICASLEEAGLEKYTADLNVFNEVLYDKYLIPLLRDQYGVYGAVMSANSSGVFYGTYADPNIEESYEVFASLPERVAAIDIDQDTLNGYILACYSSYALPKGELTGAYNALTKHMQNIPQERNLEYMRQIKGVTADSLAGYAKMLQNILDNGGVYTAGTASAIDADAARFERVLNPFMAADAGSVRFDDVAEDDADSEAIYGAYRAGLMGAASEAAFDPDGAAAYGDMALALYAASGSDDRDLQAALDAMTQFGIVAGEGDAAYPLTREDMVRLLTRFCQLAQIDVTPSGDMAEYADEAEISEDMIKQWAFCLEKGMIADRGDGTLAPQDAATRREMAVMLYKAFAEK